MQIKPHSPYLVSIPSSALVVFLGITFFITWGLIGVYIIAPEMAAATFGELTGSHPFFFFATWSPAIAAFVIVFRYSGKPGIYAFIARLLLWRCSLGWTTFILIILPLVFVSGSLIKGGPVLAELPPDGVSTLVTIMFMMLLLGPVEEFGWRGVMQPILQRYIAPIWAGLIIGVIWGIWHLPAFALSSTVYADWNFLPFFIGNVTLAILITPIFNSTQGSLLLPMLFHWQLINPFWPDAQPWDTIILVVLAVIVVWWNRRAMFKREGAVTGILSARYNFATKAGE